MWTGIAIATIYFFFCSEQKEYVMKNSKQDEFFDFVEPETDGEIEAFKDLAEKNYRKDGFETNFPSTPNLLNAVIFELFKVTKKFRKKSMAPKVARN